MDDIQMIKGVSLVQPHMTTLSDYINRERIKLDLKSQLNGFIDEIFSTK